MGRFVKGIRLVINMGSVMFICVNLVFSVNVVLWIIILKLFFGYEIGCYFINVFFL